VRNTRADFEKGVELVRRSRPQQHPRGEEVVLYIRQVIEPTLDEDYVSELTVHHHHGTGALSGLYVFVLDCPDDWKGLLMGTGGKTIDAIRHLVKCRLRSMAWDVRAEVRIAGR